MRRYLPELIALPLLPFLIAQGKYARRVTPRLPEAAGPTTGVAGERHRSAALSLLTVGESPVAGVGVNTHEEAITGQLANALATRLSRPVVWRACGKNGVTAREALEQLVPAIPRLPVDVALVAFGVNDTTAFRPLAHWSTDLRDMLAAIDACCTPRLILLSGVPPLAHFPALPQPLRWVMGLKARTLDVAAVELALQTPRTIYVPLALDTGDATMMAHDGYHPSAKGCTAWAQLLADACISALERT
ncbi:MAG TPA: SGNH/GDSL hydrolase family protein [Noviherbaspirillum sp.]|nr:SGNH/GDSL hydrolase family protein [Noviherbaspirillum sp.]